MNITFPVPPFGFNPLNATDAQLAEYAFPPRPTNDTSELALWNQEMSYYKVTDRPNVSAYIKKINKASLTKHDTVNNSLSVRPMSMTNKSNSIWSGYGDYRGSTSNPINNWCAAEGYFLQPTNSNGSSGNSECSWVGLGGAQTGALSQAGTIMNNPDRYDAFFECMNGSGDDMYVNTGLKPSATNSMYIYISYQSSNNLFNYYIADNSTGATSQGLITPHNAYGKFNAYDGSTAEWIDEIPTITSKLSNFGTINWTNCRAETNSQVWESITSSNYYKFTDGLTTLGSINSDGKSFSDKWKSAS